MKKRYIAYCRTSTENQKEEKTIELQEKDITKFANRSGIEIAMWCKDEGVSGGLEDRPALVEMMDAIESDSTIAGVVIYKLDRLARDLYIQEGLIRELSKMGKEIISTLEPDLASDDPFRKAFRQMLGVFAEFEKAMITLRMKNGRNNAVAKGFWHGGQVYGYDASNGRLVINKSEADIVRRIFHMKRYQRMNCSQIARTLNAENVPTKRTGSIWRPLTVKKMLANPIYKGQMRYNNKLYNGKHEPIIKR
ncbi:recombinase family protein [Candidatus Kaiserbacteria bacterium]|nr:recombinase family protein [Candidatus Kaiserbacteria bacterium]